MLRLACPYCGVRDQPEFRFGGQSHIARPTFEVTDAVWAEYLFVRDNTKGIFYERWLHEFGCGRWLNVARDTTTHQVRAVYRMGDAKPMPAREGGALRPEVEDVGSS